MTAAPSPASMDARTGVARLDDQWFEEWPDDLYVPPDAFAVWLERFEGPLDFLLYLVRRQGLALDQLAILPITEQYLAYIDQLAQANTAQHVELAADYLVMAAILIDLKSRALLPRATSSETLEDDPRRTLAERLQAYADVKAQAAWLNTCQVTGRDRQPAQALSLAAPSHADSESQAAYYRSRLDPLQLSADQLIHAWLRLSTRREQLADHAIQAEPVQLDERLAYVRQRLKALPIDQRLRFEQLTDSRQGRLGLVVTLLAILELIRLGELALHGEGAAWAVGPPVQQVAA